MGDDETPIETPDEAVIKTPSEGIVERLTSWMSVENQPFELGEVVRLNSGGPLMTVLYSNGGKEHNGFLITCAWFNQGVFGSATFPFEALESQKS